VEVETRWAQKAGVRLDIGTSVTEKERGILMVILVALLVVLLFVATGFAVHLLWIAAVVLLAIWLAGFVLGRGGSGRHHFYHW
jgi:hypothetical protein